VRRFFLVFAMISVGLLPLLPRSSAMTEEEAKKAFLRAREEMQTVPAEEQATPAPKPKPKPRKISPTSAPKPSAKPTEAEEETPKPVHKTTPEETPKPKKKKKHKPEPTPEETPKREIERALPAVTPRPTPAPTPPPRAQAVPSAPVTIEKSGIDETAGLEPPPPSAPKRHWWQFGGDNTQYKYLTRAVRDAIDRAPVVRHRWRYIVVHNSGTRQGNAKIFDYYHRHTRKMPNGLAYHFVIGNGTSSGNGQIEIGDRWRRQINGGHVHSDYLNNIALGICLVGDFNRDLPTRQQLEALDELIRYLRKRVGTIDRKEAIVKAHRDINPPQWPTDCPGDKFPYRWLYGRF